ncbi:MAG: hypothetical protein HY293_03370 [Planctomycetes bacterium]|nr:hypothetical protein [Planctomycetota bacterium]
MRSVRAMAALAAALLCAGASLARADERKFSYSYEAKTLPQGSWEFEQWGTLQTRKDAGIWNTLLLREELEYGITDRLNAAIYLNSEYQGNTGAPGFDNERSFGFKSMSTEWKYKVSDPSSDLVGSLLYAELAFSNEEYEIEAKLVFSKEAGPFTFAYNFIYEAELERETGASPEWRWEHILSNTLGASWSISPNFAVGLEALDIARFSIIEHASTHAYYAGPNLHVASGSWWATLTFLKQVSFNGLDLSDGDNTKYSFRLVFGVNF